MSLYSDILRSERQRTLGLQMDIYDGDEFECPVCGSCEWDFLLKDCHGDIIGCQECVTKIYPGEEFLTE